MASALSAPHFNNEEAAYAYVEARIWPEGPVCPHCGGVERIGKLGGKSTRIGTYKCYQCRKPFTVKIGTIFEASHVPLHIWLQAMFLIAGSKKGISSNQLHRILGVTLKTAWFMSHRIREAMGGGDFARSARATASSRPTRLPSAARKAAPPSRAVTTSSKSSRSLTATAGARAPS
jgi:transposase-like protein